MISVDCIYFDEFIDAIMETVIDSLLLFNIDASNYQIGNKALSEMNDNGSITFVPISEEEEPSKINQFEYDGYACSTNLSRKITTNCSIQYESVREIEKVRNAISQSIYNYDKSITKSFSWITQQDNDAITNQGELGVLQFTFYLPIISEMNFLVQIEKWETEIHINSEIPEKTEILYNPDFEIPPEFDI